MKKFIIITTVLIMILCMAFFTYSKMNTGDVSSKLLRFHVVANSDNVYDQAVKLKVRDAVLKSIGPELSKCKTRQEAIQLLKQNISKIENISDQVLHSNGKQYNAKAEVGNFMFPVKSYGSITLPEGEYEALNIKLGNGEGKNWWCVMFPPLCFIDITRGITTTDTNRELEKVLSSNEIKSITTLNYSKISNKASLVNPEKISTSKSKTNEKVLLKFKSAELLNSAYLKFKKFFKKDL